MPKEFVSETLSYEILEENVKSSKNSNQIS